MLQMNFGRKTAFFALASTLALLALPSLAEAKRPGGRHCVKGICHRVMTLTETEAQIGKMRHLKASHYDNCRRDRFNPCGLTSSGEVFRSHLADNTASSIHPDGTILLLRNPATQGAAVVRVNNFGPFRGDRKLDVSRATADRLGFARRGVASLEVIVIHAPTPAETRYSRNRRYAPVAGFIGSVASIENAYTQLASARSSPNTKIAKNDPIACNVVGKKQTPRLRLLAAHLRGSLTHIARN